jgi:hypothetical protein
VPLSALEPVLPVPRVLFADSVGAVLGHPCLLSWWIDGVTMNEFRRRVPDHLAGLAHRLGATLARLASGTVEALVRGCRPLPAERDSAAEIDRASRALRIGSARARLGAGLADRMLDLLGEHREVLCSREASRGLGRSGVRRVRPDR